MAIYPQLILDALKNVRYPGTGQDIVSAGMVADDIRIDGMKVSFSLITEKTHDPFIKSVVKMAERHPHYADSTIDIKGNIAVKAKQPPRPAQPDLLPGVKNIIAVASGKGGVGKSTVCTNLAVALALKGYKVGLLDADIFGPSVPKMFNVEDEGPVMENIEGRDMMMPIENYGVKMLSIGFFVNKSDAVVWRGAMASNALKQLIGDAHWGDLDYFLIDFPPGTSDIHLTLVQTLPITGAVIVSTPQEVALADERYQHVTGWSKCAHLGTCREYGLVYTCRATENKYYIFGKDGCKVGEEQGFDLLGDTHCRHPRKGGSVIL